MNEEQLQYLYNTLRERSLVSPDGSYEGFRTAYATTDAQKQLYDVLRQRQLVDPAGTFEGFQSAYFTPSDEVKKKDPATQAELAMAGGPDTETPAIPGVVGDLIRSVPYFGDFVDDIYRAGAAGVYRGASTTEVFKGAFGGELSDDDYNDIVANMQRVNQYGQSDEAKAFQKEYEEADGLFDQLYTMVKNPTAMAEVMVGSIAQMLATTTEAGGLGAMAVGAGAAAPVGLAGGPLAELTVPAAAMSGAVGALSGATDATATMLEIINEELQTQGMTLSKDSLQDIFEDQELTEKMRSKALARGVSIAVVDALTMGVAGRVVGTLGTGVKGTLAGGGVEMLGGGVGEAAAQVASGEPLNQGEILLEAAAEGPMVMTSLITSKQPKYTIAGQKVRRSDVEAYLRSGEDLSKVSIENDEKLSTELQDQKEKSSILANLPEDMVEADRQRAMELERERGQKVGSKLEVNKKRVSDIDTELQDIYRRYFDEGERAQPKDKQKRTRVRNADEILNNLANVGKVRVKTMRGLYDVNRMMFGLDEEQALANTIIMDRMIGQMAQRAGVEKQAMYGEIGFTKGDEATAQGLRENGAALFQNDFSDVETGITYRYDKNTDEWSALEEDGTITRNKTLADFEGEPMLVHGPDVAFSGSIMVGDEEVVKGQGGMYYPIKYLNDGVFWASKGVGPTNQAIASINKSGRTSSTGNGYMVLMTGGFDKILNSFTGFGSVVNIMNHLHTKGLYGLSQARFQRAIKQAYNAKVQKGNKMVRVFDKGVTAAVGSPQEMVETLLEDTRDLSFAARAAILDTFFDSIANSLNGSTVENRVAFKKFLAGDNPTFKESRLRAKAKMGKAELIDGFSYMIGEPFLRDMKRGERGSYAYAVLEAVRPEGMSRNADLVEYSGDSKHESYPSVIKLKEGVKFRLHALSDHSARYEDSFKHPQTGTMKTPTGANVFGGQIQMGVDVMQVTGMKPKEAEVTKGPERKVVYRAGDLVNKVEPRSEAMQGRSTGHFGTGFYFFGNRSAAESNAERTNRPLTELDITEYKLAPASYFLHAALKEVNKRAMDAHWEGRPHTITPKEIQYAQVAVEQGPSFKDFYYMDDALRIYKDQLLDESAAERIANEATRLYNETGNVDSTSTSVMKALGYEGINAVGTELDNYTYGTVVYDIKEAEVTKSGNEVWEHVVSATPEIDDVPTGFEDQIKGREFTSTEVDLNSLLETDPDFKAYYEGGERRYAEEEVSESELQSEIVVVDGELLDGYSRASELLRRGETQANAFVAVPKQEGALFQDGRGAMVREDSKAVIYSLTSPDVSTPLHEMAHVFEHYLTDAERKQIMEWAGTKEWNRDTSEAFAEGFEAWLAEGGPQESKLFNVYDSFKKWMLDIYEGITGTPLERKLNDPMRAIYAEMTGEAQAQRQQQEAGQPKKMRRFSQRVAQNVEELREDIINNPESYYEPMVYAEIRDRLAEMSHEELITEMMSEKLNNLSSAGGQIGVMAGIERMNRALAEGDFATVDAVQEKLAKIGTAAGQILRQFGELRTTTPANFVSFIERQMMRYGKEMTDAQRKRITDIANRYLQAQAQYKDTIAKISFDTGMSKADYDALEKQAKEQQQRIADIENEIDTFSNTNIERGWGDLGSMLIQGNLLTPMSQSTNFFANLVNASLVIPRDIAATLLERPYRAVLSALGKETQPTNRQFSMSAYLHGVRMFGKGAFQAWNEFFTGKNDDVSEWRMQRGFAPMRSMLALLSPKGIMVKKAKEKGVEIDSPLSSSQKAKLFVQASFGVPAEIMFRMLSFGDTPFRRFIEGVETYQAAKQAGVTRDREKLRQFLKNPPRNVLLQAEEAGKELTFQQDTDFSRKAQKFLNGLVSHAENKTGSKSWGQFVKFVLKSNVPYVKTPANILTETLEYAFWPLALAKGVMKGNKGDVRGATQSFAKGALGYMISQAAMELIKNGLLSGEPDYGGDEAERNLAYDQFPPSSINLTGLQRYVNGGDPSLQEGDRFYSYKKLGLPGVIMGAMTKFPEDDMPNQQGFMDDFYANVLRGTGTFNYMLDQSFIQGINNFINVISETDPDRLDNAAERWMTSTFTAMSATAIPNSLYTVNRARREFLPDTRIAKGKSGVREKLKYRVLDAAFGMGILDEEEFYEKVPVKVNWKGLPIQQTPPGASAWQYNLLDITKARQGEADPVSNEIYRLYEVTDEVSNVVSTPSFARNQTMTVPKLDRKVRNQLRTAGLRVTFADDKEFYQDRIALSTEQLNQLMQVAGQQRYADVQELISSGKYARMSDEERLSALDKVASKYNQRIEYVRPGILADHSVLLMSFIQQLYDGRQEEVQGYGGR